MFFYRPYIHSYICTYIHIYVHTYVRTYIHTYMHTYMPFHVINRGKPLGFRYETCPQDLTNTIRHTQINTSSITGQVKSSCLLWVEPIARMRKVWNECQILAENTQMNATWKTYKGYRVELWVLFWVLIFLPVSQ